ncbi:MAG: hypothetical protein ACKVXR_13985 [Planctomycetota bacterium]
MRKKNLLDAFREAAPEGRRASGSSPSPLSPAGGPFATPARPGPLEEPDPPSVAPRASATLPPRAPEPRAASEFEIPEIPSMFQQLLGDRVLRAVVVVAGVVVLGAFLIGRSGDDPAEAGESHAAAPTGPGVLEHAGGAAPSAGGDFAQKNRSAAKMGTEDDRAFMDPANKYTIRLIQYDANEQNLERARATAEHLRRKEGLPIVGPISMGKILVLAAGHSPKISDLDALLKHVKALPGPPPQEKSRPFSTAYVVNIDDVVKRD